MNIALRTTASWGDFREAASIPIRFGQTGGALIQYSQDRKQWVWAGHAVFAVDSVAVNGIAVGGWAFRNATDSAGQPIALVELTEPADEGTTLSAVGRGKLSPITGALMTAPADVVADMLTLAGKTVSVEQLAAFRRETVGLSVAGSIEATRPASEVIRELCASLHAIYAPDARDLCALLRDSPTDEPDVVCELASVTGMTCNLADVFNDVTIRHGWQAGQPQAVTRVVSDESVRRYGRRELSIDAFWLPVESRVALAVGARVLASVARPVWAVSLAQVYGRVRVADVLRATLPELGVVTAHVLGVEYGISSNRSAASIRIGVGAAVAASLTASSRAAAPDGYAGVALSTVGDSRVMTILAADGRPDPGATVQVNAGATIRADGAGRVVIPSALMPAGEHTLLIRYSDGQTMQSVVTI